MSVAFILAPQAKDTFLYNDQFVLQASVPEGQYTNWLTLTVAAARAGGVWIMQRNLTDGSTRFNYFSFATNSVTATLTSPTTFGETLGVHSFFELPDRTLLTVDRGSHHVVKLSSTDLSVIHTYGLAIDPLDGWPSPDGTKLCYMSGNIKQWDLVNDVPLADISAPGPFMMPVWLMDNTIIGYTGQYDNPTIGNVLRINVVTGGIINTYSGFSFIEGVHGICASVIHNQLFILGVDEYYTPNPQGDIFIAEVFQLTTNTHQFRLPIIGPMQTWFPSFEQSAGWVYIYESPISSVTMNCDTLQMTINGAGFPDNPTIQMTLNGISFTGFSVVSKNDTTIVLLMPGFNDGNYQISVS